MRELFRLPYRQTEGLGRSLTLLLQVEVAIPDYMSLAKRAAKLEIALDVSHRKGSVDVVVDSTGKPEGKRRFLVFVKSIGETT